MPSISGVSSLSGGAPLPEEHGEPIAAAAHAVTGLEHAAASASAWSAHAVETGAAMLEKKLAGTSYSVKSGDTLSAIASAHGVSLKALEAANPQISNPNLIHPGEQVHIPGGSPAHAPLPAPAPAPAHAPGAPASSGAATQTYTVAPGDTLFGIAQHYHVFMADITAANPQITDPSLIHPGEEIKIPARGSGSGPSAYQPPAHVAEPGISGVGGVLPPAGSTDARVMQWKPQIEAAAKKYGVAPALIASVIEAESSGNPNALSFDGGHGKGLMQVDDRWHAFARGPNALDPAANIDYGTSLLAADLHAFPGNQSAGIAAYNAGVGGVQSALARGESPSAATYSPGYVQGIEASMTRFSKYF